ncbi:MAG: hypothetical protein Q7V19_09985 [Bacteroidales bacterium]|nr:hypothetical protein [Bacteroidales bacterium]
MTELEHILTNYNKATMISNIAAHPECFNELVELAISDKQPYSRRALWLLWSCMQENDQRLGGRVNQLINAIPSKNDEQQRDIFIILQKMELNEESEGILFDICASVWEKIHKKPSVRYNAFKLITKIAKRYPELSIEIEYLIQEQYLESLSPCARKSILQMSNLLINKINKPEKEGQPPVNSTLSDPSLASGNQS